MMHLLGWIKNRHGKTGLFLRPRGWSPKGNHLVPKGPTRLRVPAEVRCRVGSSVKGKMVLTQQVQHLRVAVVGRVPATPHAGAVGTPFQTPAKELSPAMFHTYLQKHGIDGEGRLRGHMQRIVDRRCIVFAHGHQQAMRSVQRGETDGRFGRCVANPIGRVVGTVLHTKQTGAILRAHDRYVYPSLAFPSHFYHLPASSTTSQPLLLPPSLFYHLPASSITSQPLLPLPSLFYHLPSQG